MTTSFLRVDVRRAGTFAPRTLRSFNRTLAGASGGGYPTVSAEGSSQAAMLCGYTQGGGGVQLLDGGPFGTDFMPRVKATGFDGPAAQSMFELVSQDEEVHSLVAVEYEEDSTRARHFTGDGEHTDLYLVNPRRGTAVTVRDDADGLLDVEGEFVESEEVLPGAHLYLHHDAVGAVTASMRNDATESALPWGDGTGDSVTPVPIYELEGLAHKHGSGQPATDLVTAVSSTSGPPAEDPRTFHGEIDDADMEGDGTTAASGECCFCNDNPAAGQSYVSTDPAIGMVYNANGGDAYDPPNGIMLQGAGAQHDVTSSLGGSSVSRLGRAGSRGGGTTGPHGQPYLPVGQPGASTPGTSTSSGRSSGGGSPSTNLPSGSGTSTHAGGTSGGTSGGRPQPSTAGGRPSGRTGVPSARPDGRSAPVQGPGGGSTGSKSDEIKEILKKNGTDWDDPEVFRKKLFEELPRRLQEDEKGGNGAGEAGDSGNGSTSGDAGNGKTPPAGAEGKTSGMGAGGGVEPGRCLTV